MYIFKPQVSSLGDIHWSGGEFAEFIKAPSAGTDEFFSNVTLSGDGSVLAVGAMGEGSVSSGDFGINAEDECTGIVGSTPNCLLNSGAVFLY